MQSYPHQERVSVQLHVKKLALVILRVPERSGKTDTNSTRYSHV